MKPDMPVHYASINQDSMESVCVLRIPYPYRAMLALCSDLDETPDGRVYFETMKYLNTTLPTTLGEGVGLETGNSIYFDMPPSQFSYWNTTDQGRDTLRALIRSGHVDCIHSFGDLATTRAHAERALNELDSNGCHIDVWVDHATAPTNLGEDIMRGSGDDPTSPAFHSDISVDYGIRFVWRGRVTSVIGQDVPRSYTGLWSTEHPVASSATLLKEFAKGFLGRLGSRKYAMHGPNDLMRRTSLRCGHRVWEFIRFNPYWGGTGGSATAPGLPNLINKATLDHLAERRGAGILYTHLGKIDDEKEIFPKATRDAFRLLSEYEQNKKILVTTTSRLLRYFRMLNTFSVSVSRQPDKTGLHLTFPEDRPDPQGLSLRVPRQGDVFVTINGKPTNACIVVDAPGDHPGSRIIQFPWIRLSYPIV